MRALIFELRPEALTEEGIVAALGKQAAALSARSGLPIAVHGPRDRLDLEPKVEEHLYRIVLEALNNAIKHAHATHAEVLVRYGSETIEVTVSDDGNGVGNGGGGGGHGLVGMRERVTVYGGDLDAGPQPGGGYRLRARLPLTS